MTPYYSALKQCFNTQISLFAYHVSRITSYNVCYTKLLREHQPILREQILAYKTVFDLFDDVTVRTLDVGGDKALPYVQLPKEENPFLGVRGVRLLQTHPKLIEQQLEAIFLARNNFV